MDNTTVGVESSTQASSKAEVYLDANNCYRVHAMEYATDAKGKTYKRRSQGYTPGDGFSFPSLRKALEFASSVGLIVDSPPEPDGRG